MAPTIFFEAGQDAEPVVVFCLVGVDDDIVALSDLERQLIGDKLFDRDKVAGNDSEWVTVHGYSESAIYSGVDKADAVALALNNVDSGVLPVVVYCVDVCAVDQDVFGFRREALVLCHLIQGESRSVVPIGDGESTEINVV
jgi:hypothetical protein